MATLGAILPSFSFLFSIHDIPGTPPAALNPVAGGIPRPPVADDDDVDIEWIADEWRGGREESNETLALHPRHPHTTTTTTRKNVQKEKEKEKRNDRPRRFGRRRVHVTGLFYRVFFAGRWETQREGKWKAIESSTELPGFFLLFFSFFFLWPWNERFDYQIKSNWNHGNSWLG